MKITTPRGDFVPTNITKMGTSTTLTVGCEHIELDAEAVQAISSAKWHPTHVCTVITATGVVQFSAAGTLHEEKTCIGVQDQLGHVYRFAEPERAGRPYSKAMPDTYLVLPIAAARKLGYTK